MWQSFKIGLRVAVKNLINVQTVLSVQTVFCSLVPRFYIEKNFKTA